MGKIHYTASHIRPHESHLWSPLFESHEVVEAPELLWSLTMKILITLKVIKMRNGKLFCRIKLNLFKIFINIYFFSIRIHIL